jgi:hypothetical protein
MQEYNVENYTGTYRITKGRRQIKKKNDRNKDY